MSTHDVSQRKSDMLDVFQDDGFEMFLRILSGNHERHLALVKVRA